MWTGEPVVAAELWDTIMVNTMVGSLNSRTDLVDFAFKPRFDASVGDIVVRITTGTTFLIFFFGGGATTSVSPRVCTLLSKSRCYLNHLS